ncbi:MAG: O-antigen ligase family protein [Pyrinomonadaceae bacterium]
MTTSVSSGEASIAKVEVSRRVAVAAPGTVYRIRHSVASRFLYLFICVAICVSALAYGTVHYWALALFNLGALAVLILWVVDSWQLRLFRVSKNLLQIPLLAMIALGVFQLFSLRPADSNSGLNLTPVRTLSLDPQSTRFVLAQVGALLVYFAATLVFTDTPRRLRLIVRTIIVFGFLLAMLGLTQSFTSPTKIYWVRELGQSTAFGPFINRHHFAGYMELTLALPLGLVFSGAIDKEKRFVYIFAMLLMGVALIMTGSRGGILSVIAEVIFVAAVTVRPRKHRHGHNRAQHSSGAIAVRAALALGLILTLFTGVVLLGGESALTRVLGSVNTDDPTTGRAHFWSVTLDIIKNDPVIGAGLGAFGVVYTKYDSRNGMFRLEQAHNDYLQVLADGGLIGGALALFFVVLLFRMALPRCDSRDQFRRGVAIGATAGCFAVLIHSFFDFTLHTTSNALLFLVLAALATVDGRVEEVRRRHSRSHSRSQVAPL